MGTGSTMGKKWQMGFQELLSHPLYPLPSKGTSQITVSNTSVAEKKIGEVIGCTGQQYGLAKNVILSVLEFFFFFFLTVLET